ncbi:hypothetical protein V8G54_006755 [Vigna mungo]|uniref:C2H2-type domain-containing protein n=1 Tax=Vigna mungo TaxID=3915 RepID=A0AAQ3P402_VIGMU
MAKELQLQMAEMVAMRAERGNSLRGQFAQSVNNKAANIENGGESSHAAHENRTHEVTNDSRCNTQGGGGNVENQDGHNAGDQAGHNVQNQVSINHPDRVNHLSLIECPDQAEGLHPFTTAVMREPMPENKVLSAMEKYGGSTDSAKHLRSFVDAMVVYSPDDLDETLDWFHSLHPGTVDEFATLRHLFTQQYTSSRAMRQGREETLKTFMDRFNQTARQVRNVDQRLIINALTTALRPSPFIDYLYAEEPQTLAELQNNKLVLFRLKKGRKEAILVAKPCWEKRDGRKTFKRDDGGNEQRNRDLPRFPQYAHYTPLNEPRARVMEEALRERPVNFDSVTNFQGSQWAEILSIPSKLGTHYKRLHNSEGQVGKLGPGRTFFENLYKVTEEALRVTEVVCLEGITHPRGMIGRREIAVAGVEVGCDPCGEGGSTASARKRHLRSLHSTNRADMARRSMPTITFSDEDFHAPDPDQDDPMVITTMIARYKVGKRTFQQMDISDDVVMPFHEQILGFVGDRVDTKGYAELRMSLGMERDAKELKIRFLLVEADTRENLCHSGRLEDGPRIICRRIKDKTTGLRATSWILEQIQRIEWSHWVRCGAEKSTTIGGGLTEAQAQEVGWVLKANKDLFAWTAADMLGIHPDVISHKLSLFKDARLVAQKKRRIGIKKQIAVDEEVRKLLEAGFIHEVKYTTWLANVDAYPLPSIDGLVDGASGYQVLNFWMHILDITKSTSTYQRLMDKVFQQQIGKCMEVYVDDMVVRSWSMEKHVKDLEEVFGQEPAKHQGGSKIGKTFNIFIPIYTKVGERIKPILRVMKKDAQGCWNNQCEEAFQDVKKILTKPPVMGRSEPGHELQLFLVANDEAISVTLVHETSKFKPIYFVSRSLKDAETHYQQLEKVALPLLNVARRLRPYLQGNQVAVRTDHSIAKILRKPDLAGRMIGWSVELLEFSLCYEPRGSVRGQHLADFAVELRMEEKTMDRLINMAEELELFSKDRRFGGAEFLECRIDSQLVEGHINGNFQAKFKYVELKHIPREENVREEGRVLQTKDAKRIARYVIVGEELYRRGYITPMMKCLSAEEAKYVMRELHEGICGRHTSSRALRAQALRTGFFWKRWRRIFLMVVVDYFTKWVEAEPLASISVTHVQKFTIITNNGRQFVDKKLVAFYKDLGITPVTSSVEHPQTNSQAEAANKIIVQELKKCLGEAKGAWVDEHHQVQSRQFLEGDLVWRKTANARKKGNPRKIGSQLGGTVQNKGKPIQWCISARTFDRKGSQKNDSYLKTFGGKSEKCLQESPLNVGSQENDSCHKTFRRKKMTLEIPAQRNKLKNDSSLKTFRAEKMTPASKRSGGRQKNDFRKIPLNIRSKKIDSCLKTFGGSQKNDFRNLRSTQEVRKMTPGSRCSGGSSKNDFRNLRSTQEEVRKMTPASTCLGGSQKNDFRNPRSMQEDVRKMTPVSRRSGGSYKNDFRDPRSTQEGGSQKNDFRNLRSTEEVRKMIPASRRLGESQKNNFRNLRSTQEMFGGSQKNDFRNLRSTQYVREMTLGSRCSGGSYKNDFKNPRSTQKKGSQKNDFRNLRSTKEVRKMTPASRRSGEVRKMTSVSRRSGGSYKNEFRDPRSTQEGGSQKNDFRNLCSNEEVRKMTPASRRSGGSQKNNFRNLRSTHEVKKITPASRCSGGDVRKMTPGSRCSGGSYKNDFKNPRSTQEVRKITPASRR